MIDVDLKTQLDQLNQNLAEIKKHTGRAGIWRAFFNGVFGALGYIAGLAIVAVILGWFLQKNGLLNVFEQQMQQFGNLVSAAEKLAAPSAVNPAPNQAPSPASGSNSTLITLPNGQQYKVNVSQ